ncbi:MAG: B12-binding domain-containing radical SAM protein [Candidatus Schekmanbacteria bacterium]|nr:B12-binding domain-containing radical SAM protein [Candidatus Schekmanbacteria bacterium]
MILLINPPYFERDELKDRFERYREWIKKGNMYAVAFEPPIGIAELATFLRSKGKKVEIMDIPGDFISDAEIEKRLINLKPEIVGITAMSSTFAESIRIAGIVKKILSGTTIVLGGVHPTIMPDEVLSCPDVDIVVRGEGEYALLQIEEVLSKGEGFGSLRGIDGVCFSNEGKRILSEKSHLIDNLDDIPFPDYSLFPVETYIKYNEELRSIRGISMIAGRGCPYNCSFCAVRNTMGTIDRRRSPKKVVDKMEELVSRFGVEGIWFKDSTFNLDSGWLREFCSEIKKRLPEMKWQINTRVDLLKEDELMMMKDAGLVQIDVGIESGVPETLRLMGKRYSIQEVIQNIAMARKYVRVAGFFMIGLPGEGEKEIDMTFSLAKRLDLDKYSFSIFLPLPGTKLFDDLANENKINKKDFRYGTGHFTRTNVSFCNMSAEDLNRKYFMINDFFAK